MFEPFDLASVTFPTHWSICGRFGSGKSSFLRFLLWSFRKQFIVVEGNVVPSSPLANHLCCSSDDALYGFRDFVTVRKAHKNSPKKANRMCFVQDNCHLFMISWESCSSLVTSEHSEIVKKGMTVFVGAISLATRKQLFNSTGASAHYSLRRFSECLSHHLQNYGAILLQDNTRFNLVDIPDFRLHADCATPEFCQDFVLLPTCVAYGHACTARCHISSSLVALLLSQRYSVTSMFAANTLQHVKITRPSGRLEM